MIDTVIYLVHKSCKVQRGVVYAEAQAKGEASPHLYSSFPGPSGQGFGGRLPGFKSWLCHSLAVCGLGQVI